MNLIPLKLSATNCFLMKAEDHYVLIEVGGEDEWDLFRRRLKEAGVELSQISYIILTHHHADHSGLLRNILRENDSIRVVMSHLCKDLILKGENDLTHGGVFLNRRCAVMFRLRGMSMKFPPYRLRNCDILVTGDTDLRDIGIPLDGKILETPGHTVDSISILFDDGDCLIGDAAGNFPRFMGTNYCVIFNDDLRVCYKSWEKVITAGARQIFPAHFRPFAVDKLKTNLWKNKVEN